MVFEIKTKRPITPQIYLKLKSDLFSPTWIRNELNESYIKDVALVHSNALRFWIKL